MLVDWMMAVLRFAAVASVCPRIVSREEWGARPPRHVKEMRLPAHSVLVHHTYLPSACTSPADCAAAMRSIQDTHQLKNGWDDIGYHFVIGGDGRIYKGRGWNRKGAHCPAYNADSLGIAFIGDWRFKEPPPLMLDAAQWLIRCGVDTGRLTLDYQLLGHRQARSTECPGQALYDIIQTWEHWTPHPQPPSLVADDANTTSAIPAVEGGKPSEEEIVRYDPMPPAAGGSALNATDAVEVRQLNKRSLWDRLVHIWQQEALRVERERIRGLESELS